MSAKQHRTLFLIRQAKQVSVALLLAALTCTFLYSMAVLLGLLNQLDDRKLLTAAIPVLLYAAYGTWTVGSLARYAFIRHRKRVEHDLQQIEAMVNTSRD